MIFYTILNFIVVLPILSEKRKMSDAQKGLRFAILSVVLTQLIAVPDVDICTYWMWMNLLALCVASEHEAKRSLNESE